MVGAKERAALCLAVEPCPLKFLIWCECADRAELHTLAKPLLRALLRLVNPTFEFCVFRGS